MGNRGGRQGTTGKFSVLRILFVFWLFYRCALLTGSLVELALWVSCNLPKGVGQAASPHNKRCKVYA